MIKHLFIFGILLFCSLSFHTRGKGGNCQGLLGEADLIYTNGNIITIDPSLPKAKTVLVKNGIITKVSKKKLTFLQSVVCRQKVVNLKGKSMVPGFIDGHSHFSLTTAVFNTGFSIYPPPFGNVSSIPEMLQSAKNYILNNKIPAGQPIFSYGYSDYKVKERRHPTKYELDWISTEHPIMFEHFSAHMVVANSLAIQMVGYDDNSTAPEGTIVKYPNGTLTGLFKQDSRYRLTKRFQVQFTDLNLEQIKKGLHRYVSSGITTAQDIFFGGEQPKKYKQLGQTFPIDINGYSFIPLGSDLSKFYQTVKNYGSSWMKVRGIKFIIDGSIQGYTGLLSKPYWVPKEKQYDNLDNYTYDTSRSCDTQMCGQNNFDDRDTFRSLFLEIHEGDYDLLCHANGDAAVDMVLDAVRYVRQNSKIKTNTRFVIIHAQTIREQQLDQMVELDISASFFSPHICYWGDDHFKIFLGPGRANRINPARSALKRNITFTLHNDSPVVPMGDAVGTNTFIEIMDAAINRKTLSGRILGEEQKISPYEALKAVTINGAWQAREQKTKGSITAGKMADFVVLSDDPLKSDTSKFKDLKIIATIKRGTTVYGSVKDIK